MPREQIHQVKRVAEDAVDKAAKKRRAVFGDITNVSVFNFNRSILIQNSSVINKYTFFECRNVNTFEKETSACAPFTQAVAQNPKGNQQKKPTKKVQKKKAYLVAVSSSNKTSVSDSLTTAISGSQGTNVSYEVIQLSQGSTLSSSQESLSSQSSTSSDSR